MRRERGKAEVGMEFFAGVLAVLLLVAMLFGCSDPPTYPSTPHGGTPHDVRTYQVEYKVLGTFGTAAVLYRDRYGFQAEVGKATPGWSESWSRTIDHTDYPYVGLSPMVLAQDTTGPGKDRSLRVEIWINGALINSAEKQNPTGEAVVVRAYAGANKNGIFASPYREP